MFEGFNLLVHKLLSHCSQIYLFFILCGISCVVFFNMITSTLSFAIHIMLSTYRVLQPVRQVLDYILPLNYSMSNKGIQESIKLNGKHLKKGDSLPPYNGKLRMYNMRYCPYAQRTMLALLAKNIDFEVVNINLVNKPEWLFQKSAFGKVPSIEIKENLCIYESLVTVEYLDDAYPQRPLLAKDPVVKAFDKIIVEASGSLHTIIFKFVREPDAVTNDHMTAFEKSLHFIQNQLKERGTFLGGNEPGYADYMIWPWFERLLVLQDKFEFLKFDNEEFKILNEYLSNMLKDQVVSQYIVPKEIYMKFFSSYALGEPNYDLMCE